MPGQPTSPTVSSSSSLGSVEEEYRSMNCLDSSGESCDDPTDTMQIPDAVVPANVQVHPTNKPITGVVKQEAIDGPPEHDSSDPFEENPVSGGGSEDEIGEKWNPSLYMLQSQAPKPVCITCTTEWGSDTCQYGPEYHGVIDKHRAAELIGTQNGAYLVRETPKGAQILTFMLDERLYNFKLYYKDGHYSVGDKKFEAIEDLVQDGLITLYLQKHDVAKVMEEGRNNTMARKNEKARRLRRQHGKRVRGLKGKAAWSYSRSTSASSVGSMDVHPPSSVGNSSSPNLSRSPSPVQILDGPMATRSTSSPEHSSNSVFNSPSPVHITLNSRIKSVSPDPSSLILDVSENQSTSAPHTPVCPKDQLQLIPPTPDDISSLDFPVVNQRRSTPAFSGNTMHGNRTHAVQRAALSQRRAKSASTLPKGEGLGHRERRAADVINSLRTVMHQDEHSKSDPELRKSFTLGFNSKPAYVPFCERSNSCSAAVANTLEKLADYSVRGPSTLSRSSLAAFAKHTSGPRSPYTKAHSFQMHTYIAPTWCEICHNFLWGLSQQGMQCKDCGMDIHKQCLPLAIQLQCFPNKAFVKRVYGVDLTTLVKLEGGVVPEILSECIKEVDSRGMTAQGIYRLSGHSTEILDLKEKYDEGESVDFSQYNDENIITGAIKLYLRELPIPLITFDAYKNITKATACVNDPENEDTDWKPLINALLLLPKAHYNTLKHLAQHLHKVDSLSDENKMTARNLAVVFAPTLMRSPSGSKDHILLGDLPLQKTFVEYLITYHETLFRS